MSKKKRLSKEEKRIVILKDAIAQVKANAYDATSGRYVSLFDGLSDDTAEAACELLGLDSSKAQLQTFLPNLINKSKPCKVCAKGALMISSIAKFNNFKLADAHTLEDNAEDFARNVFGQYNADLMELYFEGNNIGGFDDNFDYDYDGGTYGEEHDEEVTRATSFRKQNPDHKKRLLLVLENALKNKSIFKPEQLKVK